MPDVTKLFLDSTFVFGDINGTLNISIIFNDELVSASTTITQARSQGGFGYGAFGSNAFGKTGTVTDVTVYANTPLRKRAKGQKFSVQYKVECVGGSWSIDAVSQTFIPFGHYKFPSSGKLT